MGKLNLVDLSKKDFTTEKLAPTTPTTIAINSSRIRSMDVSTEDVNGTSQLGTVVNYDEWGDNTRPVRLFVNNVTATLRTAVGANTTTSKKTIILTKKASPNTEYPAGADSAVEFPLEFFAYAYPHPEDAGDSLLMMISEDRRYFKLYRVNETPAAIIALANA